LAQANTQVVPLAIGGAAHPGYDPPTGGTGALGHGSGPQVNVGCVHVEAPGPTPVQVPVTELPIPPSVRFEPEPHCSVQELPVVDVPQLLETYGSLSGVQVAGAHVAVPPSYAPRKQLGSVPVCE
jgi:hypothetical protein